MPRHLPDSAGFTYMIPVMVLAITIEVLGHVTNWEWAGVEGLRHMAAGLRPRSSTPRTSTPGPRLTAKPTVTSRGTTYGPTLDTAPETLLAVLEAMGQADLARPSCFHWGS